MRRAGTDEAEIQGVLEQLRRHQLLDDQAFAEYWVEQRQTFRPRGARLLRAELARLGVPARVARQSTSAAEGSAREDAYRAASKRAAQLQRLDEPTFKTRLGQWLARRGFDWETVQSVVAYLWSEQRQ